METNDQNLPVMLKSERSLWWEARREQLIAFYRRFRRSSSAKVGLVVVLITVGFAVGVPLLDEYEARSDSNLRARYHEPDCVIAYLESHLYEEKEPIAWDDMTCEYPMGADKSGRGIMRRVGHGLSVSLRTAVLAVVISLSVGGSIGLIAGYMSGWVDSVSMRFMDVILAFPALLLAIALVTVLGPGLRNAMIAVSITQIPVYARLARSMSISIRNTEYVMAARSLGAGTPRIIRSHVLPNSLAPLIVQSTLGLGTAVIETAALGFLGLGQQPPFPELGKMLAESQQGLYSGKWWVMVFPGAAIIMIVLGFNLLGDGLRDILDPRLNRE